MTLAWVWLSRPPLWQLAFAIAVFVLALLRPQWWLVAALGLWPVIDRTVYTGNAYFAESDAVLGCLFAGFSLRFLFESARGGAMFSDPEDRPWYLSWGVGTLLAVSVLWGSYLLALGRGLTPLPALNADAFAIFTSNMEALRLASGPLLALWCLPLLGRYGAGLRQLAWGGVLALLGIGLAVFVERVSFTGLTDFASDYRTTGSFWEMHVGGAALDGALLLTLPFGIWQALRGRGALRHVAAAASLLGIYAVLAGFTRSTYVAAAVGFAVLQVYFVRQNSQQRPDQRQSLWVLALMAVMLAASVISFPTSGYRGLLALAVFTACGWLVGGWQDLLRHRAWVLVGAVLGLLFSGMGFLIELLWSKMVYAQIFAALLLGFAGLLMPDRTDGLKQCAVATAFVWSGIVAVRVAVHWGGAPAASPMAAAVLLSCALPAFSQLRSSVLWKSGCQQLLPVVVGLGCVGMITAVASSYYADQRFSHVREDIKTRVEHWRQAASLVDGPMAAVFGLGAGQFPQAFRWRAFDNILPGNYRLLNDGVPYLVLDAPRNRPLGFGEIFRVSQRLGNGNPDFPLRFLAKVRTRQNAPIHVELCRKHLLYDNGCVTYEIKVAGDSQWHEMQWDIPLSDSASLPAGKWYQARPLVFSVAAAVRDVSIDVTDIQLLDAGGLPLIDNGDFRRASWRWFVSSDRDHLPWHAKNIVLHTLVENGAIGVAALLIAVCAALARLLSYPVRNHPLAAPLAAGLCGLLAAGMFDSIIDAPRVGFMFFLWLGVSLGLYGDT